MKLTSKGEDTQVKDWKLAKSEDDLEESKCALINATLPVIMSELAFRLKRVGLALCANLFL